MTTPRIPCEFFLIRYVPDVVKGEFINIGVLLREADLAPGTPETPRLRFTRDWSRVRCMHADADITLLEGLESEMLDRLHSEPSPSPATTYPRPLLAALADSLSNAIQISEPRACLAENLTVELDQLMRLYVEPLRVRADRHLTGRAAIVAAMRSAFEKSGAWPQMRKRIPAAPYTRSGDPMKLDCGYAVEVPDAERETSGSREDIIRIFQAVSLLKDVEAAKSLAFSAPQLRDGFVLTTTGRHQLAGRRWLGLEFDLTAVVEPLRTLSPPARDGGGNEGGNEGENEGENEEDNADFSNEAADLYRFGVSTMESAGIRVLTINNLAAAAERARIELRL